MLSVDDFSLLMPLPCDLVRARGIYLMPYEDQTSWSCHRGVARRNHLGVFTIKRAAVSGAVMPMS